MRDPRSVLRYRPTGSRSTETEHVPTLRASRQRNQSTMTRPPRPVRQADVQTEDWEIPADVQAEDQEIATDAPFPSDEDELTVLHPIPERRKKGSRPRPGRASVPPARTNGHRARTTPQDQPKRRRRILPVVLILVGMLLLWLGYTGVWWGRVQMNHMNTNWRFGGHAPTDSLVTTIDGENTFALARNAGQQMVVYITLGSTRMQILSEPLETSTWGSDTSEVVPTFSVDHGRIMLTLTGDPQYSNLTSPLTETFAILPLAGSYQIERTA